MAGLLKWAPFDVYFVLHYNKSRILQCRACQDGHHLMSDLISLQLQKKYSAMEGLTKRAPFDVRFDFHYNYKSIEFCNNGGLVQTGTIWCPFWFSQLQK